MPTYEYKCLKCNHRFEKFQLITDPAIDHCPVCGGHAERIISGGAGFLFKGSGFYITDHRSDNYKKGAEKDKPPTAVEPKKAEQKSDSSPGDAVKKPEAKKPAT